MTPDTMAPLMIAYLLWDEDRRVDIRSVESLDILLDELTIAAKQDMPFSVELDIPNGMSMYMVIGDEVSPIGFADPTTRPPVNGAIGANADRDGHLAFNY